MTNYWIFSVKDAKDTNGKMKGIEVYNKRMDVGFWGIKARTPNYKRLEKNDKVVFYLTGNANEGQAFIGTATLDSSFIELTVDEWKKTIQGPLLRAKHGAKLKKIERWDTYKPIAPLIENLGFIANPKVFGIYLQGGIRSISEDDYDLIVLGKTSDKSDEIQNTTEFALEKYLQEFIVTNWKSIDFGEKLEIFKDDDGNSGEHYGTSVGYPDLVCVNTDTKDFVVIELKKGRESDKVVGQTLRYMGWIKENLAKPKQNVRGIIIMKDKDERVTYAIQPVNDKIKVMYYQVVFKLTK